MLTGKPDYIIKDKNKQLIPIEVKTGNHQKPLKNHVMQLAAYCHLIEEAYNCFTPYGILVYYDTGKQFTVQFDPSKRFELENTINSMRNILVKKNVDHSTIDNDKCFDCSMKIHCVNNNTFR
jgi:CRISPR-associated exonuclease Cas4